MSRLIDADALKEAIATHDVHDTIRRKVLPNEHVAFEWTKGDMYGMVLDAPTIDAIPVDWLEERRQDMEDAEQDFPAQAIRYVLWLWKAAKGG